MKPTRPIAELRMHWQKELLVPGEVRTAMLVQFEGRLCLLYIGKLWDEFETIELDPCLLPLELMALNHAIQHVMTEPPNKVEIVRRYDQRTVA
jgi:hypothetical protein